MIKSSEEKTDLYVDQDQQYFLMKRKTKCKAEKSFSDRFGEQRRTIDKAIQRRHTNQPTAVSDHFSLPGHSINNIELIPLELIKSNRDGIRKAREALLFSKGKTLEPHGINRRDET